MNSMVGISGIRDRQVELVKKDGYKVVVFGGWPRWEEYFERYLDLEFIDKDGNVVELRPEFQWQWKQNYPELVVEDIVKHRAVIGALNDGARDWLYGDLLYRGINKWLFVRYLLVRYKKWVAEERNKAYTMWKKNEPYWNRYNGIVRREGLGYIPTQLDVEVAYKYGYWKGYYDAMRKVRADLKTMAMTPRYVIWNGKRPGIVIDTKISRGWLALVRRLYDVRFEK